MIEQATAQDPLPGPDLAAGMQRLADLAGDVWYALDAHDRVTCTGATLTRVLGWRPDQWVGHIVTEFLHPDDLAKLQAARTQPRMQGPGTAPELRFATASGGWRWMSVISTQSGEMHAGGQLDGRSASCGSGTGALEWLRDINELVTTRQEAQQRGDLLQATMDSLLDPHVLLQAVYDQDGRIVDFIFADANDAACRYMELPRAELIGARLLDQLPGLQPSGTLELYAQAVYSGEPLELDNYTYPNEIIGSERRYDIRAVRVGDSLSFTWRDVTQRYMEARALAESESRYRLLAENAADVVFQADDQFRFEWVSPSVTELLGWDHHSLVGRAIPDMIHPDDLAEALGYMTDLAAGQSVNCEARFARADSGYRWLGTTARPVRGQSGEIVGCVGSYRDIEETRAAREALNFQATHDSLTQLANRGEFLERVRQMQLGGHPPGEELAVLFADLDNLKGINDTYGHHVGDRAIIEVANRLVAAVRASDVVGRIGGDEFVVALAPVRSLAAAQAVADKIRRAMEEPMVNEGEPLRLSLSIGIAVSTAEENAEDLLRRADRDLYRAKAINRGQRGYTAS